MKTITAHFLRSINLTHDSAHTDYIKGYIPTLGGSQALADILSQAGIYDNERTVHKPQRAHVLHAAYGSGKSLLGLVLGALAEQRDDQESQEALALVMGRIHQRYADQATSLQTYVHSQKRLFPVLLSGHEGTFAPALTRALKRTLAYHQLQHIQPHTQFQAALDTINRWKDIYPETYEQFEQRLKREGYTVQEFEAQLTNIQSKAVELFERIYPDLTAGSHFDRFAGPRLEDVFHATAESLKDKGYDGIIIIWDEFGRFLEAHLGDAFGTEAEILQSFAEFCNRSGRNQVHLVLITHIQLAGYAVNLPIRYQHEWARIAERFRSHDVSGDPAVAYELITEALSISDQTQWENFVANHQKQFEHLAQHTADQMLFENLDDVSSCQSLIERAWPLHPVTIYALPRLAHRVAQNERTLFTFLAADELGTLYRQLEEHYTTHAWWLVNLDTLWDYFAEAIRTNTQPGGTHTIWSGAMHALSKVEPEDFLSQKLIKSMAVLLIVSDVNVQVQTFVGRATPTSDVLSWALNVSQQDVETCLRNLAQRRVMIHRISDGYWTFIRGSDIDLDAELKIAREANAPTKAQMIQVLKQIAPPPFQLPRQHNLTHGITRFFWGIYRWYDELTLGCSEEFLKQFGTYGYADGVVIYVLATDTSHRTLAVQHIQKRSDERAVYVLSDLPLQIESPIQEIFALQNLQNDVHFMQQDERLASEIAFFLEDAQRRLQHLVQPLLDPDRVQASWWYHDGQSWCSERATGSQVSSILSKLCNRWFLRTPEIRNELLNQYNPSAQQVRAAETVINAIIQHSGEGFARNLNISGGGPDYLIVRTVLVRTKLLQDEETCHIVCPDEDTPLRAIWDTVQAFLNKAKDQRQEVSLLLDMLQSHPFGLRRGILPVLLATCMYSHSRVLILRHHRQVITQLDGAIFTDLCQHPEAYTIEVGPWDERRRILWDVLQDQFRSFILDQELHQQSVHYLSNGLSRWFHMLPRYCRDTQHMSSDAKNFRKSIRLLHRNPVQVLLYELLGILDDTDGEIVEDTETYRGTLVHRLERLVDEITSATKTLLYEIDRYIHNNFAPDIFAQTDGQFALNYWLTQLEQKSGQSLDTLGFNDHLAQKLVHTIRKNTQVHGDQFLDMLSQVVIGVSLYDWNDDSFVTFQNELLDLKQRVEREVLELTEEEDIVMVQLTIPGEGPKDFRFRPSDLSTQGQRILQNFKSTLNIAGRPLSPDERRQVVIALLHAVLNEGD